MIILFCFFSHSISVYIYNNDKKNEHIEPQDPSGTILIQDTIFQEFHNIYSQLGGCIYIHNEFTIIKFLSLGFVDCKTSNDGGAINIMGKSIQIQNTCAFTCEATNSNFQFAKIECNVDHDDNKFSYITLVSCGPNNKGRSAIGLVGVSRFSTNNYNSSNNMNNLDDSSYGACFRTINILYHKITYVNFVNSHGYDIIYTDVSYAIQQNGNGLFDYGNVYNCSTKYIFTFSGIMMMNNFKFGNLITTDGSFKSRSSSATDYSLTFSNSRIDKYPIGLDSNIHINNGCQFENPIVLLSMDLQRTHYCHFQTEMFTKSIEFSESIVFRPSSKFSLSITFSPSLKFSFSEHFSPSLKFTFSEFFFHSLQFTSSNAFSKSLKFTSSDLFLSSSKFTLSDFFSTSFEFSCSNPFSISDDFTQSKKFFFQHNFQSITSTDSFTPSNYFTPSFTFSPKATKYPDGLEQIVKVTGRFKIADASAIQIGATAGVSFTFIIIAVVLMLFYLKSKRDQLKRNVDIDLSDSFLLDDDTETSYYSYSYYTYTYTYHSESHSYDNFSYDYYSDFEAT